MKNFFVWCTVLAAGAPASLFAQTDTLRLSDLQAAALKTDPREAQIRLLQMQSDVRLKNINTDRLPSISFDSYAQYQSDVARLPVTFPGFSVPTPPHDTYDARLIAQQRIYDPTLAPRRAVEGAQLADAQAKVRASLYSLRQSVTDAYFAALAAQEQMAEIGTSITDLNAQLHVASARVREGTALPSEENAIRAELLRRQQMLGQANASRTTAMIAVFSLTGRTGKVDSSRLAFPDSISPLDTIPKSAATNFSRRPEIAAFQYSRDLIDKQREAISARDQPRISAFGRAGYGRPGLNPLATRWDSYWLTGVQLQWSPFNWGSSGREKELLAIQSRIVQSEEDAMVQAFERQSSRDMVQISWLESALKQDEEIIVLRQNTFAETAAKYREATVTSAEYVDKETDVLSARIARAVHRVELAGEKVRMANTLGLEIR